MLLVTSVCVRCPVSSVYVYEFSVFHAPSWSKSEASLLSNIAFRPGHSLSHVLGISFIERCVVQHRNLVQLLICVCVLRINLIFPPMRLHPAQPVSPPMPHRETISVVTAYETNESTLYENSKVILAMQAPTAMSTRSKNCSSLFLFFFGIVLFLPPLHDQIVRSDLCRRFLSINVRSLLSVPICIVVMVSSTRLVINRPVRPLPMLPLDQCALSIVGT